jgi:hypothetical protein
MATGAIRLRGDWILLRRAEAEICFVFSFEFHFFYVYLFAFAFVQMFISLPVGPHPPNG